MSVRHLLRKMLYNSQLHVMPVLFPISTGREQAFRKVIRIAYLADRRRSRNDANSLQVKMFRMEPEDWKPSYPVAWSIKAARRDLVEEL